MGHHELLAVLRQKGAEQSGAIRRSAAEAEEALRADITGRRESLRAEREERRTVVCTLRRGEILADAERKAALLRLRAEHDLALRLRERAAACLERLRDGGYAGLFRRLAGELPGGDWRTVRVNPADMSLAAECFEGADISADSAISGGFSAVTADGSLTVVNTLESRLEQCWPDLLPQLVAELRGEP